MSTDPARLTDDEREDLWRAYESWTEGDFSEHMGEAVEGIVRPRLAEVWDDGFDAGHEVARAVNPEWPNETPNPYRADWIEGGGCLDCGIPLPLEGR
jgi:hypothetical protein